MHMNRVEHAVVTAHGLASETHVSAKQALRMIPDATLRELLEIFPKIDDIL